MRCSIRDRATALALAKALVASPGARALPADELEQIYCDHLLRDAVIAAAAKPPVEQHLQTHTQQAQHLADIAGIAPSEISFMPQDLEKAKTPRQLNHLLEYLYSLR